MTVHIADASPFLVSRHEQLRPTPRWGNTALSADIVLSRGMGWEGSVWTAFVVVNDDVWTRHQWLWNNER